jgi:hypothetical protein
MEEIDLSDTERSHKNKEQEEKGADFDEISNDVGSDNEGVLNMGSKLNMVGRNDQANKNAFAQEQQVNALPELKIDD